MGDTSQAAYSGGGMRKPPMMPGDDPEQSDRSNPGRRTNPVINAKSLVTIAPGEPVPGGGMPGGPGPGPAPTTTPSTTTPTTPPTTTPPPPQSGDAAPAGGVPGTGYGPRATQAPPGAPYSHVDHQGNPTGVATINGQQRVRSGSWWLDKKLVDLYGENDDRAQVGRIEYSQGLNQMAAARQAAATAAKTTSTGFDSEQERSLRQQWANEIGVDEKSDLNQDDPVFVAKQVLVDLIKGGHVDKLSNGLFFSFHGDTAARPWEFKNANGQDVAPTAELVKMATAAQAEKNARYQSGAMPGSGATGAPGAVDINGLPVAPGANAYGLPGVGVGWQTQARPVANYNYAAKGALAMPGSNDGVPVIMAEAGVPEIAIPIPKLRAAVGDDAAQRAIDAVKKNTIYPGAKLAAGALTMGAEGTAGSATGPNTVPAKPPTYTQIIPPGGTPNANGGYTPPNGSSYTPFTWDGSIPGGSGAAYTPFSGWTPGKYTPYQQQQMTDQEKAQLASISEIAKTMTGQGQNLYSIGAPAYAQAIKYYQTLVGGNRTAMQAATAGSAEAIRAQGRGLEGRITAQLGRSGAADLAKSDAANQEAAAIAHLTQGVQPAAAAALQGAGLEGAQAGGALEGAGADNYARIQQALTQSRQYEEGLRESSRQFGASYEEQSRQFGTQLTETSRQYAASLAEQVRQGNMSYAQAMAALELNDHQFQTSFGMQQKSFDEQVRQFNESLKVQKQGISAGKSSSKGAAIASGIGTAAMIVIAI